MPTKNYCEGCMGAAFGDCDTCRHFALKADDDKSGMTAYEADYWVAEIRRPGSNVTVPVGIRLWAPSTYEQALREALYIVATCEPGDTIVRVHKLEYIEQSFEKVGSLIIPKIDFCRRHNETINS